MTDLPRDRHLCSRRAMLFADGREHRVGGDGVSSHHCARAQGTVYGHQNAMALAELDELLVRKERVALNLENGWLNASHTQYLYVFVRICVCGSLGRSK